MSRGIAIKDLKARDKILIQTRHSTYCFTVIDPVQMSGFLSGGVLLNRQHVAFLRGGMGGSGDVVGATSSSLSIDSCAIFYLEENHEHLVTSAVTRLDHIGVDEGPELYA